MQPSKTNTPRRSFDRAANDEGVEEMSIMHGKKARRGLALTASAALCALAMASPSAGHHSFAMFNQDVVATIEGTVAEVQWVNPHVWVEVDVPDENGETTRWGVEFTSRVHLTRRGWSRDTLKPGDRVSFELNPYYDGRPGGRFYSVTLLDTGETIRDLGAQRAYEVATREEGGTPEVNAVTADDSLERAPFYRVPGNAANAEDASYAALDALPDWRGIWQPAFGQVAGDDPQLIGEYKTHYEAEMARVAADPSYEIPERVSNCESPGMPYMMVMPYSVEFLFTPGKVTAIQEAHMQVRQIFTDGRSLPENPAPTYFGYSVGHWEDDGTLVVETIGTRPGQRLGIRGITNSDKLKITERIYLDADNPNLMHLDFTYEDPEVLAAPWHQNYRLSRNREWALIEYLCDGNDRHPIREDGSTDVVLNAP